MKHPLNVYVLEKKKYCEWLVVWSQIRLLSGCLAPKYVHTILPGWPYHVGFDVILLYHQAVLVGKQPSIEFLDASNITLFPIRLL